MTSLHVIVKLIEVILVYKILVFIQRLTIDTLFTRKSHHTDLTLSANREPLSLARASIADTFDRSKNAAIALACWAIEPVAK